MHAQYVHITCANTCIRSLVHVHVRICARTHARTHTHTHTYACTCTHICTDTDTHTQTTSHTEKLTYHIDCRQFWCTWSRQCQSQYPKNCAQCSMALGLHTDGNTCLPVTTLSTYNDTTMYTLVANLPDAWHYRVRDKTGWPHVSVLWLGEMANLICNFYLSVAACIIV